jgi:tetratricopeptide (TPR) repeat protein/predicted Ser/Thr protein kinase
MRFTAGQSIGRYVIESLLGEGGMGEVYRARDSKLERSVALKVLRNDTEGASDDWNHAVMRMQREAQAVAALSHPGIVAIYDIGEHEGSPFIAMELVGGKPLRDLIGTDTPLPTRLRILLDVARALGAAHEAGFVHRDIKPENILVREDGRAKVLDFGIARKTSRNADHTAQTLDIQGATIDAALVGMTADGAIVGTPAYMSPEQIRGETADAQSDQFAWGVVAYELLSGKHPFHSEKGALGMLAAILGDAPAPLEGIADGISSTVLRALEKEPEKRWASMHEIVLHYEAFVTDGDARKVPTGPRPEIDVTPGQTGGGTTTPGRSSRTRWVLAPIFGFAALTAVVAFAFRERPETVVAPVALPSAAPTATATAVTDLALPASNSIEALAAYREGVQNIRDARWTAANAAFDRARKADPGMAAAHFRYSIIQFSYDVTSARDAYRKALGLRTSMSERDQNFLQALEPLMLREPSDYGEATKRMEVVAAKYPYDAELTFWHSRMLIHHGTTPESMDRVIALNDRCVALDPQYADCWQTKASALSLRGKREEAGKALDECIKVSENGADCLLDKIDVESFLGHCDVVVELAQQLKAKDPLALHASLILAEGLYYKGEREPVVRAAFIEADRRSRELGRQFEGRRALLTATINYGEFTPAIEHANFMTRSMTIPQPETELGLYYLRASLYTEMGKYGDAAAVADEFFVARTLRPIKSVDLQADPTLYMHALRLRAGKLTLSEYQTIRAAWIDTQPRDTPLERILLWLAAYAGPAFSVDQAKEALENMPDMDEAAKDDERISKPLALIRGRVLGLAGKHAEAIPLLKNALQVCKGYNTSLWHTQTFAMLGIAKEATGDKPGACQAYDWVLSHWGKSKESLTVKDVVKRAKKIGCGATAGQ